MIQDILEKNGELYEKVLREEIANTALPKRTKVYGIVQSTTIASGKLNESITSEVTKTSSGYELSFLMLFYAKFLDNKRYPKVPVDVLLEWMKSKGIEQNVDERTKVSIAFAIQTSLADRKRPDGGTVPEYSDFLTANLDLFIERICHEIIKELELEVDVLLNQLGA